MLCQPSTPTILSSHLVVCLVKAASTLTAKDYRLHATVATPVAPTVM